MPYYTVTVIDETCAGLNDGAVHIDTDPSLLTGDVRWSHGATGHNLDQLEPGYYTFHLESVHRCTASDLVQVMSASEVLVVSESTPVFCFRESDGSFQVTAFGGTPPYTQTRPAGGPDSLSAGWYYFVITGAQG